MKLTNLFTASVLVGAMISSGFVMATDVPVTSSFSGAQKAEIEVIVRDYLVKNPGILVEMSNALQKQQMAAQQSAAKVAVTQNAALLLSETLSVAGNPHGDVTLVEFFDYQCIHCKKIKPTITQLIEKNPNLRVIFKEFPIFGKTSQEASKAALAAAMQGKYIPFQTALLKADQKIDDATIFAAAQAVGLNVTKLKVDMQSPAVAAVLKNNEALAEKMHLMGTPAFIIMQTPGGQWKDNSTVDFIPGAATEAALQALITQAAHK